MSVRLRQKDIEKDLIHLSYVTLKSMYSTLSTDIETNKYGALQFTTVK